jgi:hypothetical protein
MTENYDSNAIDAAREEAIESLLTGLPETYEERYKALQNIRHAFHSKIASALQPLFNEYVAGKPQDSADERQELAGWINQQLRDLGLALECPITKRPASLIVDRQDREHPEITRFRYSLRDAKSTHTASRRFLGELELMEQNPRIEPLSKDYLQKHPRPRKR